MGHLVPTEACFTASSPDGLSVVQRGQLGSSGCSDGLLQTRPSLEQCASKILACGRLTQNDALAFLEGIHRAVIHSYFVVQVGARGES